MELALTIISVILIPMIGAIASYAHKQKDDRRRIYERIEKVEIELSRIRSELEKHLLVHKVKLDK